MRSEASAWLCCACAKMWRPTKPYSAVQLGAFLQAPLRRAGGMLTLPEAFCLFNRARGAELVSPDDMLKVGSVNKAVSAFFNCDSNRNCPGVQALGKPGCPANSSAV